MTDYITLADVLAIHADQLVKFGGASGVRDPGSLESALFRPQTGYYDDVIQEAAALWESLSQNHPFVDCNKRAALAATDTFLMANGYDVVADPLEAYAFMIELYESGRFRFEELDAWLRAHTVPWP